MFHWNKARLVERGGGNQDCTADIAQTNRREYDFTVYLLITSSIRTQWWRRRTKTRCSCFSSEWIIESDFARRTSRCYGVNWTNGTDARLFSFHARVILLVKLKKTLFADWIYSWKLLFICASVHFNVVALMLPPFYFDPSDPDESWQERKWVADGTVLTHRYRCRMDTSRQKKGSACVRKTFVHYVLRSIDSRNTRLNYWRNWLVLGLEDSGWSWWPMSEREWLDKASARWHRRRSAWEPSLSIVCPIHVESVGRIDWLFCEHSDTLKYQKRSWTTPEDNQ